MKCFQCGSEIPEDSFFCGTCGAPVRVDQEERTLEKGELASEKGMSTGESAIENLAHTPGVNKWLVVTILVVGIVVIAGIVTGILLWRSVVFKGTMCEIRGIQLTTSRGSVVSLDDVPLGENLTTKVRCVARFGKAGSGRLEFSVFDEKGSRQWRRFVEVKSGEGVQVYETEFIINESEGEKFRLLVNLLVRDGEKTLKRSRSLSFFVEEGSVEESYLESLKKQAMEKLVKADSEVQNLMENNLDAEDLAELVAGAEEDLRRATTQEEIEELIATVERIINECRKRQAAAVVNEEEKKETCQKNQADLKQKLIEYYNREGDFPDDLSELGNVEKCPSGGSYNYAAPDTTPASLRVSCSVHGSL